LKEGEIRGKKLGFYFPCGEWEKRRGKKDDKKKKVGKKMDIFVF
jgi:hypothetical protein